MQWQKSSKFNSLLHPHTFPWLWWYKLFIDEWKQLISWVFIFGIVIQFAKNKKTQEKFLLISQYSFPFLLNLHTIMWAFMFFMFMPRFMFSVIRLPLFMMPPLLFPLSLWKINWPLTTWMCVLWSALYRLFPAVPCVALLLIIMSATRLWCFRLTVVISAVAVVIWSTWLSTSASARTMTIMNSIYIVP